MPAHTLYVFGDQSAELLSSIRELSVRSRRSKSLGTFLRTATDKIQLAWARVPSHIRPQCPPFDSVVALAEAIGTGWGPPAFVSALLSVSQLGNFILHLESDPRALEITAHAAFFGICTGSLAAAAVAASRNLTELVLIAPQIVSLAFQLGLEATKRSWLLENSNDSWATIINSVRAEDVQDALNGFNQTHGDDHGKRVYISASGGSNVTISGPPSSSRELFSTWTQLSQCRKLHLPIRAAFHASHLNPIPNERLFDHVSKPLLRRPMQHVLVSPSSGRGYESDDLEGVLQELCSEILQQPIDWQQASAGLSRVLARSVTVQCMGPVNAIRVIRQALPNHEFNEPRPSSDLFEDDTARYGSGAIAIVGMSVRLPGSETLEDFWNVLEQGRDLHEKIRPDRFNWETHCDPSGKLKNTTLTPYGVFIDRPGYFDARFFNMSPREAMQTDPQQRLLLLTTYEALEHAGYSPNRTPSTNKRRIASFVGQTGDDYREVNAGQEIDTYFITGGIRAFGPGRINYHFGWEGPSYSVDTACSSSATSIQLACSALLNRECDTAVAGGANLLTTPDLFAGLSRGSFLSKTGGCKTFDSNADGYVRADGCGVLVIKRLEDAIADRDNITAVLRGAITNHSAEAVSITHPHDETQQRLFKAVLNDAGIVANDVDYAELHGTGTQAGDATESRSVMSVLCQGRAASNPLYIGSVKPNLGHGEAASGVTSVIKAILMLQKNMIPPHVGIKGCINPKIPSLKDLNTRISFGSTPFVARKGGDGKRRILVNNFDAAGGNTSLLLEDPPKLVIEGADHRSHKIVALSAKSTSAMTNNARSLLRYLEQNPEVRLEDIAYTTTARRMHHPLRRAYCVATRDELVSSLTKQVDSKEQGPRTSNDASTVMCFTGQGSQYVSMCAEFYKDIPAFRELIHDYAAVCMGHGFPSFLPIIEGDAFALESPVQTQLAIVAVELALTSLWRSLGVRPKAVVGHSLGEYAALCCAGVLSQSDCLYLVGKRASLMTSKCVPGTHAMLAVQAPVESLRDVFDGPGVSSCQVACHNSPTSMTISGLSVEIDKLFEQLKARDVKATRLEVPFAFHSSQLDSVLEEYEHVAARVHFAKPEIPVASSLLGDLVVNENVFNAQYLVRQAREPVLFHDAVNMLKTGLPLSEKAIFIEVGPHPICMSMLKQTLGGTTVVLPSVRKTEDNWRTLASSVASAYNAGLEVNWSEYNRPFESAVRMVLLPNYNFDLKNYWMQYEGDWTLHKGSQPLMTETGGSAKAAKKISSFSTTGLHRIDEELNDQDQIIVKFSTDAKEPTLNSALRGHLVNGAGLCPSSIYADMAFTAATYAHRLMDRTGRPSLDVCNMEVHKPLLITPGQSEQVIRIVATLEKSSKQVHVTFSSQDGKQHTKHAQCLVRNGDKTEWQSDWSRVAYLVQARMDDLVRKSQTGTVHKILRPMAYKLFSALVDYDRRYQGMDEVYLDSIANEATANVKFKTTEGDFTYSPYWIDSIAHLSGFVLNGSDTTPSDSVFISHGWESMKFANALSAEKQYRSYVRMQPTQSKGVMAGDVYLFDGEQVVGMIRHLKFQQVKRAVLNRLLPNLSPATNESAPIQAPRRKSESRSRVPKPRSVFKGEPAAKPKPDPIPRTPHHGIDFDQILAIIAQEVGMDESELEEEVEFTALGVDSLLTINILTNMCQQIGQELPASLFLECPMVKDLRAYFDNSPAASKASKVVKAAQPRAAAAAPVSKKVSSADRAVFDQVLEIIASAVSADVSKLSDATHFTDLGVDSLSTITILTNVGQQTGCELPASIFLEYPTIGDLRRTFERETSNTKLTQIESFSTDTDSVTEYEFSNMEEDPGTPLSDYEETDKAPEADDPAEIMKIIIAEEVGVEPSEIEPDTLLVEFGVDSLLSLSILTRLREETGTVLPAMFLVENPTLAEIQATMGGTSRKANTANTQAERRLSKARKGLRQSATASSSFSASSILLQGSSLSRDPCFFLFPDGSGSASSYVGLPPMHLTGPVYGLNSPFLSDPTSLTGSLQEVVAFYIDEIKRVQPTGPYMLGGWSSGGICAYEAASQLISRYNDEIAQLVLIDAPCPTVYPPLPMATINFLTSVGAFDRLKVGGPRGGSASTFTAATAATDLREGVREHFEGSLNALVQYYAEPMDRSKGPKSVIALWARHGVWQSVGDDVRRRTEHRIGEKNAATEWVMDFRDDYGPGGWEELLPGTHFTCQSITGDHFSIMRRPGVVELGEQIGAALTSS